jgi:hypothetical protein
MKAHAFTVYSGAQAVPMPKRIEAKALHVHAARIACIKRLGANWVKHPAYTFNLRHSHNPEVYEEARRPFLADIARRAAADRERRESFQSAQRVRSALRSQP